MRGVLGGVLAGLAVTGVLSCGSATYPLEVARGKVQEFHQELELLQASQAAGDAEGMRAHQEQAVEALNEARQLMERARAERSERPDDLLMYSEVLTRMGDTDLAAEVLNRAVQLAPELPRLWAALGQALATLGPTHATEAVNALRRAIELEPEPAIQAEAYSLMGSVYAREHLFEEARKCREKAMEIAPDLVPNRVGLAVLDIREGRLAPAAETLDEVMAQDPGAIDAFNDAVAEAVIAFEESRNGIPDEAASHLAYAKLLVRANRFPDAVPPLERSLKLDPNNYVAWNLMGSLRQGLDDTDGARQAFERSLALNPDQPKTKEAIEALADAARKAPPPLLAAPRDTPPAPAMPTPTPAPAPPPTDDPVAQEPMF